MTLVERCYDLAKRAHEGQTRRGGEPYITHPMRVAARLKRDAEKAVALLHDVIEDGDVRIREELVSLCNDGIIHPEIYRAVLTLTKMEAQTYRRYLGRVKANPLSRAVKIADMLDNLADQPTAKQVKKYAEGLAFLLDLG